MRKIPFVSLFSGIGGKSLGFSKYFEERLAIDNWEFAAQTHRLNFPDVMLKYDMEHITAEDIIENAELKLGQEWLLIASPPCQAFSRANRHRKVDDERNELYPLSLNLIKELGELGCPPTFWLIENVSGVNQGEEFEEYFIIEIAGRARSMPYYFSDAIKLNALFYNTPQKRIRSFYFGMPRQWADDLGYIPFEDYAALLKKAKKKKNKGMVITAKTVWPQPDAFDLAGVHEMYDIEGGEYRPAKKGRRITDILPYVTHVRSDNETWISSTEFMGTITASGTIKVRDLAGNERPVTTEELLKLSGFPTDYRFPLDSSATDRAKGIGNSVPPPFAEAFAAKIHQIIGERQDWEDHTHNLTSI